MPLVRPEDPAQPLLAKIIGCVALAQDRQLLVARFAVGLERRIDVGDDELVLDRNDRDLEADHLGRGAGIVAGSRDHVLGANVAFGRLDDPFIVVALDPRHGHPLDDLGTGHPGPLGQCHRDVHRCDVPVGRVPERAHETLGIDQRPQLLDLVRADQVALDADGLGRALVISVLVHAVAIGGEPKVAGLVQAYRLAGLGLELLVELDRVLVQLAHRIGHVEERQEPGSVPGGAGGELGALEQHAVGPALLGQMVERAHAHHTTADHHHPCCRSHRARPLSPHACAEPAERHPAASAPVSSSAAR